LPNSNKIHKGKKRRRKGKRCDPSLLPEPTEAKGRQMRKKNKEEREHSIFIFH
jgi:hypothetical protein